MKHIILDTDIGGDPDDALALLFGLYSPEIQIDLIVTSDEHRGHRYEFAKNLLQKLEKYVPLVKGNDLGNNKCCVVDNLVNNSSVKSNYLSEIKKVIQRNSKTYYVCLSPQTNLAKFLECAPELKPKFEIVIMGGAIDYGDAEHNIKHDIKSAIKVLDSDTKMRYVIRDTTFNPAIKIDENHPIYKKLESSNFAAKDLLIKSFQNYFIKLHPATFMHDPLTLSYTINPKFLEFEERKVEIERNGLMHLSEKGKLLTVSTNADYKNFMKFFSERLPF